MTITYYISGPMRGYPRFNFDAFLECEQYMQGIHDDDGIANEAVAFHNPAQKDLDAGFDPDSDDKPSQSVMAQWMRRDLTDVAASDFILLLPGWEKSEGARRELSVAKWCGLRVKTYNPQCLVGWRTTERSWEWLTEKCNQADREKLYDDIAKKSEEQLFGLPGTPEKEKLGLSALIDMSTAPNGERRTTSSTGGEKGVKPERHSMIPTDPLAVLARVYGYGAEKYSRDNWRKGYEWSKSYDAMQRHLQAFWGGEDHDPESGELHLGHAAFHVFTLIQFLSDHPDFDDRYQVGA